MKKLHQPHLFGWSEFNQERNIDFHGLLWVRATGNVAFDPLPLSDHDLRHLEALGGLSHILLTNSDHVRAAGELAQRTGALLWGPAGERENFPLACEKWLADGDSPFEGLEVYALEGSKTPGELAFVLDGKTLITGDLIRAHEAGKLCLLPDAKLKHKSLAIASLKRLAALTGIEAVLPGDGWPVFRNGHQALAELLERMA